MRHLLFLALTSFLFAYPVNSQTTVALKIRQSDKPVPFATVIVKEINQTLLSDSLGQLTLSLKKGLYTLKIQSFDTKPFIYSLNTNNLNNNNPILIVLKPNEQILEEVVISGSLREVGKLHSTVPVEIYNPSFFKKNPTSNIFEALQNINGVRPQLNCNICNTGDIHINGLEGPYTMILIDGMPVVSSLATVYGLTGIPNSLVERMEIVRGPSSALYGSEAIGGIINIITKSPDKAARLSIDGFINSWLETNLDLGFTSKFGKKVFGLTGVNFFNYSNPIDNNNDNFTDLTLQKRISVFQKFNVVRKSKKSFSIAGRYFYEDRWGGEINWTPNFRGGDSIYGESIYTSRYEVFGNYELPIKEKVILSSSLMQHSQNSYYGTTPFMANQRVFFGQLAWYKTILRHAFVLGSSFRNTNYDDNTPATSNGDTLQPLNQPESVSLPGIFFQDDWSLNEKHKLLFGLRYDYSSIHKSILTPRFGYKFNINKHHLLRINTGTGYRVVSIFTEDHAALSGARKTEIVEELKPERSINVNLNYYGSIYFKNGNSLKLDFSPFYTYFTNKIMPDYETDPTKIIYKNIDGFAESKGVSLNTELRTSQFIVIIGGTLMEVSKTENGIKQRQVLTENFTGTWSISYSFKKLPMDIDYTGSVYSPMKLPTLGPLDPRSDISPWWSIQNIQFTYKGLKSFEIYTGVKNLLNWVPGKKIPFLIARSHDPFDKLVNFNADGSAKVTTENPYGLTFDPTYVYGPNQGIRVFFGLRYSLKK
jgi:outer membrane receptor for ferrienterochelin and colicins